MADIFISYANEDRERAGQLAALLESVGTVWWDRRIPAGRTWRALLEQALGDARCMVVLWSENSVNSPWVGEEAEEARRLGKTLLPVLIQRVEPPMGFRTIQAADLTNWDGSPAHPAAQMLIADLRSLLGAPETEPVGPPPDLETDKTSIRGGMLSWFDAHRSKVVLGAFLVVVAVAGWQYWPGSKSQFAAPPAEKEDPRTVPSPAPRLTNLAISTERKKIQPSETLRLALKGQYSDGTESELRDGIQWSSSDLRVASIDADGEVTALRAGTTHIIAKVGAVASPQWTLSVENRKPAPKPVVVAKLTGLQLSSSKRELVERETVELRAKAMYSDQTEKYLTSGVEWQVSDRSLASINARGELVALRPGKVRVVARSDDLSSAPVTFLIKEARRSAEAPSKPIKPAKLPPVNAAESPPVKPIGLTEQARARVVAHLDRAQTYREQGNYAAALGELEKAKAIDAMNEEIRKEIEQTQRACNAEKILGNKADC